MAALFGVAAIGTLGFAYGFLSHRNEIFPYAWVRSTALFGRSLSGNEPKGGEAAPTDAQLHAQLDALGYLQGYQPASGGDSGVVVHEAGQSQPGLNFYVSGHAPEASLMTMEGEIVHSWAVSFSELCPRRPAESGTRFWRRARLLPDGSVLVVFDYQALAKLDRDSKVVWKLCAPYHHDIFVEPDGRITTLRRQRRAFDELTGFRPILDDEIEILSRDGEALWSLSVIEAFRRSDYAPLLDRIDLQYARIDPDPKVRRGQVAERDVLHTNAVKVLDGRHASRFKEFKAGNLLISVRNLDIVAVVDPEERKVVWAFTGLFRRQHEPVLLPTGSMLVFDNFGHRGKSRVVEFDPLTQEILWSFTDDEKDGFLSACCGSNQRLANGNTLVTDTENGRAVEVTPDGETVWEFRTPHRTGEAEELIATLLEVIRLEDESEYAWLDEVATGRGG